MAVAPPKPRDLPLNALRAFEAAARLGSFVAAAQELGVTPGAVTAHVKALEKTLGAGLFERSPRGVKLTRLGERVSPAFTSAFDALADASRILQAEAAPRQVHVATLPSLAQLWLSPRLPALRAAAPEISISITAMEEPPNLKRAPYDLCLFYGEDADGWLARDVIFPVCSPALAARLEGWKTWPMCPACRMPAGQMTGASGLLPMLRMCLCGLGPCFPFILWRWRKPSMARASSSGMKHW
ncbi:LysR family transcriptional regulator [Pannonibacter sp. Pt2-lr]